ncbi:MAG: alpha/beta fold hydrolase [Nitrospiraceae bacterium]|nr:alpha/beta fold hydrolase [Nitrospiraceae bacterium]
MTKWTLDVTSRLMQANVRLHDAGVIEDDMAALFVVNDFTRLETLLLPYELHRERQKVACAVAADELFEGALGTFLRSLGMVSTKDPNRDAQVVRTLLSGDPPWVVFPAGPALEHAAAHGVGAQGRLRRWLGRHIWGSRHDGGGAALALRAEFCRRKLECLRDRPDGNGLEHALAQFGMDSLDSTLERRTVVVPVSVTYFPIRSDESGLLQVAEKLSETDLSENAIEAISVDGTVLSKQTDIDITLGTPIDVWDYLDAPDYAGLMACGLEDADLIQQDPRSLFNEAARRLLAACADSIRANTTVNADHVLAAVLRRMGRGAFTMREFRQRAALCAREMLDRRQGHCHPHLEPVCRDLAHGENCRTLDDFLDLCLRENALEERSGVYRVRRPARSERGRRPAQLAWVIAEKAERIPALAEAARRAARTPGFLVRTRVRSALVDEDLRQFEQDYEANYEEGLTKEQGVGRPFLLRPVRPKGGVVLIHGYMAAPLEMRAMGDYLLRHGYAVYGVRLKGHGTSPADLARTPWHDWYESVNRGFAIMQTITDHVVIGGFSMGGGLALLAAGRKGANIHGVFAIDAPLHLRNPAARLAPSVVRVNAFLKRVHWPRPQWEYLGNDPENKHINYTSNPVTGVAELGRVMSAAAEVMSAITVPSLIVQGSADPLVHPDSGQTLFDKVGTPYKELHILCRDRHGIINGPGSREVFFRVTQFLRWTRRFHNEVRQGGD